MANGDSAAGTPPASREPASARAVALLLILTGAAFGLRVIQLRQSLVGDEVFTFTDVHDRSFGSVVSTVHTGGENSPPLYFLLAWLSAQLGDPAVWIRLPSLVFSTATVPLVYLLGRESVGRRAALIGAGVLALSPTAVFYGTEARPYATMVFFVVISTLALLRAVETRSSRWWLVYALASAAAAYSHYTSIFVLVVQAVWSVWMCRERISQLLGANALVALLYAPWLPHVRGKELAVIGALHPLGVHTVLADISRALVAHPSAPLGAVPGAPALIAIGICLLVGLAGGTRRWRASSIRLCPRSVLIAALAVATPVGLLLYSLLSTDLFLPRGLLASLPAAALLLAAILSLNSARVTALLGGVVLAVLLFGTVRSLDAAYRRAPFREMAAYLDKNLGSRDAIIYVSFAAPGSIAVYLHPHLALPPSPSVLGRIPRGGSAYVVLDREVAPHIDLSYMQRAGFQVTGRKHFAGQFPTDILTYRPRRGAR
ncbi:MAG: glycosyltransferase family 39 protein [Solirubrobacteraceae bacterium]